MNQILNKMDKNIDFGIKNKGCKYYFAQISCTTVLASLTPSAFGIQSYDNLQWILAAEVNVHY